jgi:hypothetical protein
MQKPGKHGAANALADDENVELHRGKDRARPIPTFPVGRPSTTQGQLI